MNASRSSRRRSFSCGLRVTALAVAIFSVFAGCAYQSVPMQQDDFGLNFITVRVNGHPGWFLVDTGASHTVIDQRFAEHCIPDLTISNLRLAWLGASNAQTMEGTIDSFQIGNHIEYGPYRAHVLNLDAINDAPARLRTIRLDGIIGADFLISHAALVDYRDRQLLFSGAPVMASP